MATTAMDYENPGGDRFEGTFAAPPTPNALPCTRSLGDAVSENPTLTLFFFLCRQTRPLVTSATTAVLPHAVTMATTAPAAVLLRPALVTGKLGFLTNLILSHPVSSSVC